MQIESARERHERMKEPTVAPGETALKRERESIELSRSRVLRRYGFRGKPALPRNAAAFVGFPRCEACQVNGGCRCRSARAVHGRLDSRTGRSSWLRAGNFPTLSHAGFSSASASGLLVIFMFSASHSSFVFSLTAIAPRAIHSVNGAETLKLEQAGTPPLHARIQSR